MDWFGYWYEIPLGVAIAAATCAGLRGFPAMQSATFLCAAIGLMVGSVGVVMVLQYAYVEVVSPAAFWLLPASLVCLGLHVGLDPHHSPWALLVLAADLIVLSACLWMVAHGPH